MTLHPDIERVALLGWHVYPASRHTKAGCFKGSANAATCDLNQLARWTREYPNCNWRVVCGPSNVWGLDLDTPATHAYDGVTNFAELVKTHGPLPLRPTLRSGGGGLAIFFRWDGERIKGDSNIPAPGIDPRRGRQSQTIPPSVHITTGKPYRWINAPWDTSIPIAPAWLIAIVREPDVSYSRPVVDTTDAARRQLFRATQAVVQSAAGSRNNTLNKRSFQIGCLISSGLLGEQEAIEALYGAARVSGLDHAEAKATIMSGVTSGLRRGASG